MSKIKYLQQHIEQNDIDAILVVSPSNRRYLSGFTGSTGYVLVTPTKRFFFSDFRYIEQSYNECKGYIIISTKSEEDIFTYIKRNNITRLGVERGFINLKFADYLRKYGEVERIVGIDDLLMNLRMIKNEEELFRIRCACEITDLAFENILTKIQDGITEAEINFELQTFMRRYPEVERMADRFIVASGARGSLPHGIAGAKIVRNGEFITMDFGCCYGGYWSDITRTVCLGEADSKQKEIYSIVLEAQRKAITHAKAGITGREVDKVARDIIENAGYGKYFGHGLGHSFGLDIHEPPRFAQNNQGDVILKPGMIMTVEPGIYIPNWGGVRIEDDILITQDGCINLTGARKELIEII